MKAILFYVTAIMLFITLCITNPSFTAVVVLAIIDAVLILLCMKYLSLRDIIKFTGYDTWYKHLR